MTINEQRVAVVTGASSGIGKAAAMALANRGWRVIGLGRDPERCRLAEQALRAASPAGDTCMLCVDLALMADTRAAAERIKALTGRVDALLNNAGGVCRERRITAEGNENTFAGNHLGHFLLTRELLPLMRETARRTEPGAVRVVAVSSTGHEAVDGMNWDDLQGIDNFVSGHAYCHAKLANILFTRELARRLAADGIVAHAMHPGVVESNFISHTDDAMRAYMETLEGHTPEEAADTLVWLATAAEPGRASGLYYHQRQALSPSAAAMDDEAAARLWRESEALIRRALPD